MFLLPSLVSSYFCCLYNLSPILLLLCYITVSKLKDLHHCECHIFSSLSFRNAILRWGVLLIKAYTQLTCRSFWLHFHLLHQDKSWYLTPWEVYDIWNIHFVWNLPLCRGVFRRKKKTERNKWAAMCSDMHEHFLLQLYTKGRYNLKPVHYVTYLCGENLKV